MGIFQRSTPCYGLWAALKTDKVGLVVLAHVDYYPYSPLHKRYTVANIGSKNGRFPLVRALHTDEDQVMSQTTKLFRLLVSFLVQNTSALETAPKLAHTLNRLAKQHLAVGAAAQARQPAIQAKVLLNTGAHPTHMERQTAQRLRLDTVA